MSLFFFLVFIAVTIICLIPFLIAFIYFIAGIKSYITGRKEKNRNKIVGGINTVFFSILAMPLCFLFWYWLCRSLLSWEL
jgi:ABC-type Fe3+ transport system permease subunit